MTPVQNDKTATKPRPEDLRMEYEQVGDNLRAGVTILWEAFKTYFTIAGLLFAGIGYLFSLKSAALPAQSKAWLIGGIGVVGFAITVLGCFGIWRIVAYQGAFLAHGALVGKELGLQENAISKAKGVWDGSSGSGHVTSKTEVRLDGSVLLTYWVFLLFGLGFLGAIAVALRLK